MNILILRTMANVMKLSTYNLQEVGLAKALVRLGHRCDILYYTDKKQDSRQVIPFDGDKSITILWAHGKNVVYEGVFPCLPKILKDYDIIQVSEYIGINSLYLNARHQDKTVNYQGPYYSPFNKKDNLRAAVLDRVFLPFCHKKNMVVGCKSVLAAQYLKGKGIEDVTTLGVGIDLGNLQLPEGELPPFVEDLKANKGDSKYLLYIGRMEPRRNVLFLLEAAKKAMDKDNRVKLVLVGRGEEDYLFECRQRMQELGISDRVLYAPQVDQKYMQELYRCCDVFLLPTRYEIFGMVLLEAMYFGIPVLTTYNGGSATLIEDGKNGFVADKLDPEVWAKTICRILGDEDLALTVAENAHRTVAENYTWDALAPKFIELYTRRLQGRPGIKKKDGEEVYRT